MVRSVRKARPVPFAPSSEVVDLAPLVVPHAEPCSSELPGKALVVCGDDGGGGACNIRRDSEEGNIGGQREARKKGGKETRDSDDLQ